MFLGKCCCWSLQRLKGVIVGTFVSLPFHLVLVLESMIEAESLAKLSLLNVCGAQYVIRVVTKISSCRINTTSRRGIKQLVILFYSIFVLFSYQSSRGPRS